MDASGPRREKWSEHRRPDEKLDRALRDFVALRAELARIGVEQGERCTLTFYGHSFIADHTGAVVEQADDRTETVLTHAFDLDAVRQYRHAWGVFRDRRPDLYGPLLTLDGSAT